MYEADLTPAEAWELLENHEDAVLVDVRTPEEWAEVGIPDLGPLHRRVVLAPLLTAAGPNPDFLTALADAGLTPGDSRPVLFVCKAGGRSVAAARLATQAGLGPAYNVVEGYEGATASEAGWAGTGLPVARWDGEQA